MDEEEEQQRGMTPARWAAVACLGAFAGVPVLSLLLTLGSGDDASSRRQLLLGLGAAVLVLAVVVVVVRRVVQNRVDAVPDGIDDWRR